MAPECFTEDDTVETTGESHTPLINPSVDVYAMGHVFEELFDVSLERTDGTGDKVYDRGEAQVAYNSSSKQAFQAADSNSSNANVLQEYHGNLERHQQTCERLLVCS